MTPRTFILLTGDTATVHPWSTDDVFGPLAAVVINATGQGRVLDTNSRIIVSREMRNLMDLQAIREGKVSLTPVEGPIAVHHTTYRGVHIVVADEVGESRMERAA